MKKSAKQTILIVAPHTDDGELGCGGSIAKFCEMDYDVFYAAFSICSKSLPGHLHPQTLAREVTKATNILGVKKNNLLLYDFEVRRFSEFRQDILEKLVQLNNSLKPDLVFVPSSSDIHQDHQVISEEGLRAFKTTSLLGYEMPWNNVSFKTNTFIKLDEKFLHRKIRALEEYKSQKHRSYLNANFIRSLAITRGVQIGCSYAEAFEVIRWII